MEIRQLEYLIAIADEANFSRAAEKLFVSQPALTQQIKKLEKELDTVLFDRGTRQIRLTASGNVLYLHAQTIFQELNTVKRKVQELQSLDRGTLRIGVVQTVNAYLMPTLIAQFNQQYQGVRLFVEELSMDEIEKGLETGHLQLGIGFLPLNYPSTTAETLFKERLIIVSNQDHSITTQQSVKMQSLQEEMVMLSPEFCTRRLWDDYASKSNLSSNISIEMNTIHSILETLRYTNLISILPELALKMKGAEGLVGTSIHSPVPERIVSVLWRTNAYRSLAAVEFTKMLNQIIAKNHEVMYER